MQAASVLKITIVIPVTVAVVTAMHGCTTGFASLYGLLQGSDGSRLSCEL